MALLVAGLSASLVLAGCVPVLIGGAAVGGYYLGKDDRSPTQIAADSSITAKIKSKFVGDKYVDAFEINVDTYDGAVTLHGDVTNTIAREQAGKLASQVEGVKSVDNRIRVLKPVKEEAAANESST
ncbi:MAG: BON domain-containing protein [Gammaproteobacteria bacterium]